MAKQEIIPQAVENYFESGYKQEISFVFDWKNYKVYYVDFPELSEGETGLPIFLLYDGKNVRRPNTDEFFEIWQLY